MESLVGGLVFLKFRGEELDRDLAVELRVIGEEDFAHAAPAETVEDAVAVAHWQTAIVVGPQFEVKRGAGSLEPEAQSPKPEAPKPVYPTPTPHADRPSGTSTVAVRLDDRRPRGNVIPSVLIL